MEESSACLRRSISLPSPTSSEEKRTNPIQRALTSSVSFGRFMSESLDWEKWSAFTHNRYLEEVEKYSKPGSVAEKKAYFEAHYKRRRAAALLEQENEGATDFSKTDTQNQDEDNNSTFNSDLARKDNDVLVETLEGEVQNCDIVFPAETERTFEDVEPEEVEEVAVPTVFVEDPVELTNGLQNNGSLADNVSNNEDKPCKKDARAMRIPVSSSEKKPGVPSSKFMTNGNTFKQVPSSKQKMPVPLRNSDKTTQKCKNGAKDSVQKRKSNSMSLHMSIDFAPCSGDTRKASSPGLPKIANSRPIRAPVKRSGNSMLPPTSTRVSVNGIMKHHSATTPAENRTIKLQNASLSRSSTIQMENASLSGSRMMDRKVPLPCTRSSTTFGCRERSPTISSSFTLRSEERAAKRQEFFQKLKSNESEKKQLHLKPQVKAKNDSMEHLVTNKTAETPLQMESQSNLTKKVPTVRPCSPNIKERAAFRDQNHSRPPWRFSNKTENSNASGKNKLPSVYSAKSLSKKSTSENSSPNIQL